MHSEISQIYATKKDDKLLQSANSETEGLFLHDLVSTREEPSEIALPALLVAGEKFDFCFIVGLHTFDQTLLVFYYLNRMLKVGELLAIDDVNHPAVNKAVKYIYTYPCYRLVGSAGRRGTRRKRLNIEKAAIAAPLRPAVRPCGEAISHEFLDTTLVRSQVRRALDTCTMVAFEKTAEDDDPDTNWCRHL